MQVTLVNESGLYKKLDTGENFLCLIFGGLVPLFKGDFKIASLYFLIVIGAEILFGELSALVIVLGLSIYLLFTYNNMRIRNFMKKGYKPATDEDKEILIKSRIMLG